MLKHVFTAPAVCVITTAILTLSLYSPDHSKCVTPQEAASLLGGAPCDLMTKCPGTCQAINAIQTIVGKRANVKVGTNQKDCVPGDSNCGFTFTGATCSGE